MGALTHSEVASASGSRTRGQFNGVQVFSATMAKDRELLGERVTAWLRERPGLEVVDTIVTQSSDDAFHCLAITLFYNENL